MNASNVSPLVPEASPAPDPIANAISKLKHDPGVVFEAEVLVLLRQVRDTDPARWARYRQAIKEFGVVSMVDLDKLTSTSSPKETGNAELFPEVKLWPDTVDGTALLHELAAAIRLHVIADPTTIHAAALWVVFTWFIDVVDVAPIANITAPEKRCGKSVMLGVLARLAYRPLTVSNIAPAALFRALQLWGPSLMIDEVDSFLAAHEEARGILNAGFTRDSAYVIRCVGDDHMPTRFNVWGAKALCGIGKIADTLADRSIPLRLRRKLPGERTVKIRHADADHFATLSGKLARFAIDNRDAVRLARPAEIEGLNDRANDCWEPLLKIAEVAGGDWSRLARQSAITLHGLEEEAPSVDAELLNDIRTIFTEKHALKMFGEHLLVALLADEEAPWATWNRGRPMTRRQLTARVEGFGVKSKDVRIGVVVKKGFERSDFEDVWKRYLPATSLAATATTLQSSSHKALSDFSNATQVTSVAKPNTLKANSSEACNVVADQKAVQLEDNTAEYF
ncbi:DUF3631 domain-containing protein [Pseudomonas moraviensis]|uniref:DUF3631 domain-containing protein n=1 Tax=Pseudomonas moraviensis TaxID=321662 RepID=A0A7Y9VW55_9PSED|nr:DUF3631 domain-containing protein [Pseudomonas moraviensis]NYH09687.1 hypothetical protein [Pseudomonas moraviensis]